MYDTTERLLTAFAVNIYGLNNDKMIQKYIKNRSFNTVTKNWQREYYKIVKECFNNGYDDIVEYCENLRLRKLVEVYKEKIKLRDRIINGDVTYEDYLNEMAKPTPGILGKGVSAKEINQINLYFSSKVKNPIPDIEIERRNSISRKIKDINGERPKSTLYNAIVNVNNQETKSPPKNKHVTFKTDKEDNPKHLRKFYTKMNHDDQEFSDFIDKIEEYNYYGNTYNESLYENKMSQRFPLSGKVKNKDHLKEIKENETEKEKDDEIYIEPEKEVFIPRKSFGDTTGFLDKPDAKRFKKVTVVEEQYDVIADRVISRRREEKDKTAWPNELKIIFKVAEMRIEGGTEEESKNIKESYNTLAESISKEGTMSNYIFQGLMTIQLLLFSVNDKEKRETYMEFKKVLCAFFDFYRK